MKIKIPWLEILIIILFLLSVYLILTRIFGHSATDLIISTSLFTFLGGLVYYILDHLIKLNREFGEFKIKIISAFERLKEDINYLNNKIPLMFHKWFTCSYILHGILCAQKQPINKWNFEYQKPRYCLA